jgi:hypothetical protein
MTMPEIEGPGPRAWYRPGGLFAQLTRNKAGSKCLSGASGCGLTTARPRRPNDCVLSLKAWCTRSFYNLEGETSASESSIVGSNLNYIRSGLVMLEPRLLALHSKQAMRMPFVSRSPPVSLRATSRMATRGKEQGNKVSDIDKTQPVTHTGIVGGSHSASSGCISRVYLHLTTFASVDHNSKCQQQVKSSLFSPKSCPFSRQPRIGWKGAPPSIISSGLISRSLLSRVSPPSYFAPAPPFFSRTDQRLPPVLKISEWSL